MRTGTVGQMQKRAWGFYGYPGSPNLPVGEVRYVVGWLADQMTRLEWDVLIDGSEKWTVDLNAEGTPQENRLPVISTTRPDGEEDVTAASAELLELIGWDDQNVRAVTTNLFVGGEGDYIKEGDRWRVLSVVENKRKEIREDADEVIPFIWPHPADPKKPDAPLFSVLELLDELEWLNLQARTQSKQRVMFSGILATADELEGPDGASFWDVWNNTLSARTNNPDDMSPVRLSGPIGTGTGPNVIKDGLNWIMPPFGYDQTIDRRVIAGIQRLAYGLPIPPEILLGMQAQSRATAFQVEENAYRAHIEPPGLLVAQVPQDALDSLLDQSVEVVPNPSQMLARKQSVEDVKWANAEGLADDTYTREVLGIPEDGAPVDEEDLDPAVKTALDMAVAAPSLAQVPGLPDLVAQIRSIVDDVPYVPVANPSAPIAKDPANDAADEPVTAATTDDLSTLLADIDAHLSAELAGYTTSVTDRARQRLGAAARSMLSVKEKAELKGLSSAQVAVKLGVDGLVSAGVKVDDLIAEPIDSATKWWTQRITEAWEQASTLVPGWVGRGEWVEDSVAELDRALSSHILATLGEPDLSPLTAGDIRAVVDAAAGG